MLRSWAAWASVGIVFSAACGGKPEIAEPFPSTGQGGTAAGGADSGKGGSKIDVALGGKMVGNTGGATSTEGCSAKRCPLGQHCVESEDEPTCVESSCDDLNCGATEECQAAPNGGNFCASIACDSDVDCPISRYCDGKTCVDDSCEPETRSCDGDEVRVCTSNGGESPPAYTCRGAGYFESKCSDEAGAAASLTGCTCEGEWDCPEYTTCEAGVCVGTGVAPTCTLPPTPFEDVLPKLEFRWGGKSASDPRATGKAFAWSSQVAATPVVINLDDDNGDGLINELDFPEILFTTHVGDNPHRNGVVRAVHAGGPDKGKDYFALCGTTRWFEGDPITDDCDPNASGAENQSAANVRPAGTVAAGDLDGDGIPEIVVPLQAGGIEILDARGNIISSSATGLWPIGEEWKYPGPAIANIDFEGFAEIAVGNRILTLKKDANDKLVVDRVFTGQLRTGTMKNGSAEQHHGPAVCFADLTNSPGLELVAGTTLYRLPDVADCAAAPNSDYCLNRLTKVWDGTEVNPGKIAYPEGFCAVADVLGEDVAAAPGPGNPLDGTPEVLVMADGHLLILKGDDGTLLRDLTFPNAGNQGGAPNVDDFDGDGFPEIATALSAFYTVFDLQEPNAEHCPAWPNVLTQTEATPGTNPERTPGGACTRDAQCNDGAVCNQKSGQCVCLHSGWKRQTEDDSSKVTSSSVFDFNGDGAAEVVYNDECYFRIYDGASGGQYVALPSLSRTIVENPVVADVDNDGNAEIVFVQNNAVIQCQDQHGDGEDDMDRVFLDSAPGKKNDVQTTSLPNGLEVWGDPSDVWVSARRVWNQHSYHVTNVTEGGRIPLHEPEHWKPLNGRFYNTYRSQPRNYGVAPDLTLTAIQITSPDVSCGELSDEIQIAVQVKNAGDLRVGPGVVLAFDGSWESPALSAPLQDENGDELRVTLTQSLEPGASTIITVPYLAGQSGRDDLPVEITASIDADSAERECHEDNNQITGAVEASDELADLRLTIDEATDCEPPQVTGTLYNDGSLAARDILVRIYAGDPSQGGQVLGEITVAGPLEPGASEEFTLELENLYRNVTLYGVADPTNTVMECNDANNVVEGPVLMCMPITR